MSKLFQVEESDLAELEQILPELAESMMPVLNARLRIKLRRCQTILSQVRWKYGPALSYGTVAVDEDDTSSA